MRSTRASAAVERLKTRSGNTAYSMSWRADGLFSLMVTPSGGTPERVGEPLALDAFVSFVNGLEAKPRPVSKLDEAFRTQLKKK